MFYDFRTSISLLTCFMITPLQQESNKIGQQWKKGNNGDKGEIL